MVATSAALMAHHLFSCWHGDFRLRRKYGEVSARGPRVLCVHAAQPCRVSWHIAGVQNKALH